MPSIDLVQPDLTLVKTSIVNDRTTKFYSRAPSGENTGTLSITGSAYDLMLSNSYGAPTFTPLNTTMEEDDLSLSSGLVSLVAGGTGTILCRFVYQPDDGSANRRSAPVTLLNDAAPNGGLRAFVEHQSTAMRSGRVEVFPDGAAVNGGTVITNTLGNKTDAFMSGVYFEGFGAKAGIICHGQAYSDTSANAGIVPPSAFSRVTIGKTPLGMATSGVASPGYMLTHCVVYDRMVSDDEAFDMATGWAA